MTFTEAALTAMYPVLIIMAGTLWIRYFPILAKLDDPMRVLVCGMLLVITGVAYEQVLYGFARYTGEYIQYAANPILIGIGKLMLFAGMLYKLYAFWLISPVRPQVMAPIAVCVTVWGFITIALMR